jgi:hypothetical protein
MPFIYASATKQVAENYTTSGSGNTEIDFLFLKPGATRPLCVVALRVQGKGAGLTALSGIVIRPKQWTSTASSGGTSTTPAPKNNLAPACVATAGMGAGGGTGAVTSGTGGPSIVGLASMGASGPGGTVAINPDDCPVLDGNANKSYDLFSSCPTVSLSFEAACDSQEG